MAVSWPAMVCYRDGCCRGCLICSEGFHSPSVLFFFSWFALLDSLGSRRGVVGGTADFGLGVSLAASPKRSAVV